MAGVRTAMSAPIGLLFLRTPVLRVAILELLKWATEEGEC